MNRESDPAARLVLYEGEGSRPVADVQRYELIRALLEEGYSVTSARSRGNVSAAGHGRGMMVVLGRFDDPSLEGGRGEDGDLKLHFLDVEGKDTASVVGGVNAACAGEGAGAGAAGPKRWKPWFPVIDYDRCTNCMQCMSFCLFDVYAVSKEGQIKVQNQSNCKTDCPACSRVCPEVAILFPKYRFGPINGDEVNPEDLRREAMKVDISALLGGDIYAALRDRSAKAKSRFSKERDEDRALKERQRCLEKLQRGIEALDVPPEVLSSLPSPEQIRARAEQARARVSAALESAPTPPQP